MNLPVRLRPLDKGVVAFGGEWYLRLIPGGAAMLAGMAGTRMSKERSEALARAEQMYIWGVADGEGKIRWPSYAELAKELNVTVRFIEDQAKKHKWVERRQSYRNKLAAKEHASTRRQWEKINQQVLSVSHQSLTRLTKLLNDDLLQKERQVQRAKNLELLERAAGNDDAVVPYAFDSGDLLQLARAIDLTERSHARVMARAQALPMLHTDVDEHAGEEPDEAEDSTALTRIEDIIAAVAKNEVAAGLRNGTLGVRDDGTVVPTSRLA